jgi:phage repressor protein C with HTH and peptisase S24 domain
MRKLLIPSPHALPDPQPIEGARPAPEARQPSLGRNLRASRERLGLQQVDVAEHLRMTGASVSNWEKDANVPDMETLFKLCKLYDVTLDELTGFTTTTYRSLSMTERQLVEQYRKLDPHGLQMVASVMKMEVERMQAEAIRKARQIVQLRDFFMPASAGIGEYLPEGDNYQWLSVYQTPETERADMIVHVSGDSMRPTLKDGDQLLIQQTETLSVGELGVFLVNGDGYVKELGKGCLVSHNRKYKDIRFSDYDDVRCVGRVLGLLDESDIAVEA